MARAADRVVVAMSGGVDSAVAAWRLLRDGWDVTGCFLRAGSLGGAGPRSCCSLSDGEDARRVAETLGVPFYVLNYEREFRGLVEHFVSEVRRGRTPNPCILCNRDLKFGRLLEAADAVGAGFVATGHYARVVRAGGRRAVARGRDPGKDQSYVLFPLTQEQLGRTVLPLGDLAKARVRELAREAGLPVSGKPESQEICFVPEGGHRELLRRRGVGTPGVFRDTEGREVGRHDGYEYLTVGQRRGLGLALGRPVYVTGIDPATGDVTVGGRDELRSPGLLAGGWVGGARDVPTPGENFRAAVQIRYRHRAAPAVVRGEAEGRVRILFDAPQSAVTPGQAVVAYEGDVVLGGGWIERALPRRS